MLDFTPNAVHAGIYAALRSAASSSAQGSSSRSASRRRPPTPRSCSRPGAPSSRCSTSTTWRSRASAGSTSSASRRSSHRPLAAVIAADRERCATPADLEGGDGRGHRAALRRSGPRFRARGRRRRPGDGRAGDDRLRVGRGAGGRAPRRGDRVLERRGRGAAPARRADARVSRRRLRRAAATRSWCWRRAPRPLAERPELVEDVVGATGRGYGAVATILRAGSPTCSPRSRRSPRPSSAPSSTPCSPPARCAGRDARRRRCSTLGRWEAEHGIVGGRRRSTRALRSIWRPISAHARRSSATPRGRWSERRGLACARATLPIQERSRGDPGPLARCSSLRRSAAGCSGSSPSYSPAARSEASALIPLGDRRAGSRPSCSCSCSSISTRACATSPPPTRSPGSSTTAASTSASRRARARRGERPTRSPWSRSTSTTSSRSTTPTGIPTATRSCAPSGTALADASAPPTPRRGSAARSSR